MVTVVFSRSVTLPDDVWMDLVHRISLEEERDHVVIGVRKRSDFESRDRVRDTARIDETNKLLQRVLELDS